MTTITKLIVISAAAIATIIGLILVALPCAIIAGFNKIPVRYD